MEIEISNLVMWILVIVIIIGMVLCFKNINQEKYVTKYEGLMLIAAGLISSCIVGVMSNK